MELREALRLQGPSLELQRSAANEIARQDAELRRLNETVADLTESLRRAHDAALEMHVCLTAPVEARACV